jgi:hypothetical protein
MFHSAPLVLHTPPDAEVAQFSKAKLAHIRGRFDDITGFVYQFPHLVPDVHAALNQMRVVTDVAYRKQRCAQIFHPPYLLELSQKLNKAIEVARSSPNAQNAWLNWCSNGFGLSSKLTTDYNLSVALKAVDTISAHYGTPFTLGGIPGLIAREASTRPTKPLGCHHDQYQPTKLIADLETYLATPGQADDFRNWAIQKGIQTLVHSVGGKTANDSATHGYKNLTPRGLLAIMEFLRDGPYNDAAVFGKDRTRAHFFDPKKTTGPWFYNLDAVLGLVNARLAAIGLSPIHPAKMAPEIADGNAVLAWFCIGTPHFVPGSTARRFTTTICIQSKAVSADNYTGMKRRLDDLVDLANEDDDVAGPAAKRLKANSKSTADGTANKRPDLVVELMQKGAPFHSMLPKRATADAFLGKVRRA